MSDGRDLAAHLKYYRELGVEGLSKDAAWRRRSGDRAAAQEAAPAAASGGAGEQTPVRFEPGRRYELTEIREVIGDCTRCKLHQSRTNLVFGVGDPHARLMFVGEGPGADEDLQGEPFVGRAGQLLTQIIKAMGFTRE